MAKLSCEICGGKLVGKPGGIFECDSCGTEYSTEWAKAKVQEINGTVKVEGTVEVQGSVKIDGPVEVKGGTNKENLVKRAKMKLEDAYIDPNARWFLFEGSDYHSIKALLEQALEIDPEYDEALLYMLLIDNKCRTKEEFQSKYTGNLSENKIFQRLRKYAKGDLAVWAEEIRHEFDEREARRTQQQEEERIKLAQKREKQRDRLEKIRPKFERVRGYISTGSFDKYVLALKSDGTVLAYAPGHWGSTEVESWRNITAVAVNDGWAAGLKSDGTVVAARLPYSKMGNIDQSIASWKDITSIAVGDNNIFGLRLDGSVIALKNSKKVRDWEDIVQITADRSCVFGVKSNGTVVFKDMNKDSEHCVSSWTDIAQIAACCGDVIGLKKDGTVISNTSVDFSKWENIVSIAAGYRIFAGLTLEGKVLYKDFDMGCWRDSTFENNVVAIGCGEGYLLALKANGEVKKRGSGIYVLNDNWRLFNSIETVEDERRVVKKQHQEAYDTLIAEQTSLNIELANLKGLFTGKRRKELENRLAEVEARLAEEASWIS